MFSVCETVVVFDKYEMTVQEEQVSKKNRENAYKCSSLCCDLKLCSAPADLLKTPTGDFSKGVASTNPKEGGYLDWKVDKTHLDQVGERALDFLKDLARGPALESLLPTKGKEKRTFSSYDQAKTLVIGFTDLEPDDSFAFNNLLEYQKATDREPCAVLPIFQTDLKDKEPGTILGKKLMALQEITGVPTDTLCMLKGNTGTPTGDELTDIHKKMDDSKQVDKICDAIKTFLESGKGEKIKFNIMAPGHGSIHTICEKLKEMGLYEKFAERVEISMYTGSFNIRGCTPEDLEAIMALQKASGKPLIDASKFLFFGENTKRNSPFTASLSTIFPEGLAEEISKENPELAAVLKSLNDEFNVGLIVASKIFDDEKPLTSEEEVKVSRLEGMYKKGDIEGYCKQLKEETGLYSKVKGFKKPTIEAFATGKCDSPLCDQLLFIIEKLRNGELIQDNIGKWYINNGVSGVNKKLNEVDLKSKLKGYEVDYKGKIYSIESEVISENKTTREIQVKSDRGEILIIKTQVVKDDSGNETTKVTVDGIEIEDSIIVSNKGACLVNQPILRDPKNLKVVDIIRNGIKDGLLSLLPTQVSI